MEGGEEKERQKIKVEEDRRRANLQKSKLTTELEKSDHTNMCGGWPVTLK